MHLLCFNPDPERRQKEKEQPLTHGATSEGTQAVPAVPKAPELRTAVAELSWQHPQLTFSAGCPSASVSIFSSSAPSEKQTGKDLELSPLSMLGLTKTCCSPGCPKPCPAQPGAPHLPAALNQSRQGPAGAEVRPARGQKKK